ncbi:hypothetical protein GOOTI_202_00570 [Gordonia otitidis NBRC 100426]|uniref:Uncharacterized protein n=1 Tax=Gordonia otitidis (strain DSM 44809 / CCUG 52243 / JCM 12355 / NBRC 100426 / IFM 10032) TaxID=1108044 RepID=H5TRU3_GORO1|nr:hypothetical protein GOOTI_202_00570 [Gordonia otitidis NBRC 100426]
MCRWPAGRQLGGTAAQTEVTRSKRLRAAPLSAHMRVLRTNHSARSTSCDGSSGGPSRSLEYELVGAGFDE